ncbi:MAG TPA: SDR family NAD(P)-dependent oxidoreductase, partial [Caldithrix abyssi]|nr:SDR family NAD(P)-dependent oxidoreductase [Caldithrix abyssi]
MDNPGVRNMSTLEGKRVLITGASSGIGRACAEVFAAEGAHLILIARRRKRLDELGAELKEKYGISVETIVLDVRQRPAVEEALKGVEAVDVLINNAGLALGMGRVQEANPDH